MDNQKKSHPRRSWLIRLLIGGFGGVVLLMIGAVVVMMWPVSEGETARRALDLARLADLPKAASSVKADGTSNMFSMTYLLRFQAPAAEIEAFITQSPGLSGIAPEIFTPEHMCLPYPQGGEADMRHHHFRIDARYPWFDPTIRDRGRRYVIPQDADACWGEVIVDDETNTVFVQSHRS